MAKYRAKATVFHPYREGDIVDFKDELHPGFAAHFEAYDGDEEVTDVNARNPLNDPTAAGTQLDLGGPTPADPNRKTGDSDQGGEDEDNDNPKQPLINPSREELKERAQELGIDFAPNITTERLLELVRAKEAEGQE